MTGHWLLDTYLFLSVISAAWITREVLSGNGPNSKEFPFVVFLVVISPVAIFCFVACDLGFFDEKPKPHALTKKEIKKFEKYSPGKYLV